MISGSDVSVFVDMADVVTCDILNASFDPAIA